MADAEAEVPRFRGRIMFYNPYRRYGFVRRTDGTEFYVGPNALMEAGMEAVAADDLIEFSVAEGQPGRSQRAVEIMLITHGR
jgi:cold shock CspA family protein